MKTGNSLISDATRITSEIAKKLSEKELEELDSQLDEKSAVIERDWNFQRPFEEYEKAYAHINRAAGIISREVKLRKKPNMTPLDKDGNLMTLEEFKECCRGGGFIDYDGFGYYSTETEESDITIKPSDITSGNYRKDFTHINWYNR